MLTWSYFKEVYGLQIFYIGTALEFTLLFYAYSLSQKGKFRILCDAMTSVVFAKLIDELFFDPTVFEISEVMITILGFIILYVSRYKRRDREATKDQ